MPLRSTQSSRCGPSKQARSRGVATVAEESCTTSCGGSTTCAERASRQTSASPRRSIWWRRSVTRTGDGRSRIRIRVRCTSRWKAAPVSRAAGTPFGRSACCAGRVRCEASDVKASLPPTVDAVLTLSGVTRRSASPPRRHARWPVARRLPRSSGVDRAWRPGTSRPARRARCE